MNVKEITERLEMIADVESLKTINSIYSDRSDSFVSVNNVEALRQASALLNPKPIPKSEWHEDHGAVLWWKFPIVEPPYSGSPLDEDWPGYHTHWTPFIRPEVWERGAGDE
ncbi:hypothetical protein ABNB59_20675 [Paenibacillus larvae]|uniref:Uncharacterized protein n=2 Tax=Paenibacillus larvae TaxID=1464 RepID=A0AAP5JVF0_9BACL|nr:hypothetical protein [Paenibacillus larvae]UYE92087.1 hypothetical protein LUNBUN_63 [Paenibacillus phage LunBun]UYE92169.1 hypothetical protein BARRYFOSTERBENICIO_63 [Paenibacillus phage BarryFoster_Benicio]UYL91533.1 hypothetical protein ABATENZ_63 [Paenibacillus phage ABAtENZ]UYL91615.1 hypothetical protein AJG77_63 [Paenibacillus phage AJG77]UYL91697.1 hypothetical protein APIWELLBEING_63 [Paenibacillus phage ApiWellbeing]UYL91779.1 hypothetical protein BLOOMFIELD_63 [Paenibacillus pha